MTIETIEVAGMAAALTALRLPFGKEVRSDINYMYDANRNGDKIWWDIVKSEITIDPKDLALMQTLIKRGTEHAKVTRGIVVWAKITAPIYWWCEMETYVVGHQRLSSESTMHIDCQGLRNIVKQRWNHRLPEWHLFVDWVKTLPFAQELILEGQRAIDIDKACGAYCLVCKERDTDCFEYCKGLPGKAECNAIMDFRKAMEED